MTSISLTPEQQCAVETAGRSVLVSAAAGSGKTAVLARRVAYLVCDAPSQHRCNVDQLLVLTFTDAAASEMKSRITDAIRERVREQPHDDRLREQLALMDTAQISTVHSFCLWIVRRWFMEAGVDPNASILDSDEATLLKREVLDGLCARRDGTQAAPHDPLGIVDDKTSELNGDDPSSDTAGRESGTSSGSQRRFEELGEAFVKLVDDYGLGDDRDVTSLILKLYEFTGSLSDPDGWLRESVESVAEHPERPVREMGGELKTELIRQADHCDQLAGDLEAGDPVGHFYAVQIRSYGEQLRRWDEQLTEDSYEPVRQEIADFTFSKKTGPRLPKDVDPALREARDAASKQYSAVKERLFKGRLHRRFALFSVEELAEGSARIAPYVATIVDTVTLFREEYADRKRRLSVLDFADFERFAFDLLRAKDDPGKPSDVGRVLHRRFRQVLVDEFQDINPIQEAIICLASHESDSDRVNNLFVVGDVKQSIYRFRLAEPAIFTRRSRRFRDGAGPDAFIALQSNFRSRPEILGAANVLFGQLMRQDCGGVVYDAEAELHAGRAIEPDAQQQPVEVHLLERAISPTNQDDDGPDERGVADLKDPARWTPIEREAFLIGSRIRDWMEAGEVTLQGRPLRYRDVAVLLRATKINAERMAAMLASMGVPAYADVGGSLFGALEIRDVLAALRIFDNFQQDIPLTAVLRSSIMGERLSEDDLVEIRCHDRDIPFHAAVRGYLESDGAGPVRERLTTIVGRIRRYRSEVRCRPLADVLWKLYEQYGYLAYVSGLPNGGQRRANLLKLHELARKFGSFRRQGLHRFLQFVESLEEENRDIASAPALGEADDVVRIMSIHQSKGLEFPVVFVAGLGRRFNLGDRSGRMIFEREAKIGLRVVDTERMIEYPTAAHRLVAAEVERSTREEELRILYVAMTRARDRLVLVGSGRNVQAYSHEQGRGLQGQRPASTLSLATAETPLGWLVPALAAAPVGAVAGLGGVPHSSPLAKGGGPTRQEDSPSPTLLYDKNGAPTDGRFDRPLFEVHIHEAEEIGSWSIEGSAASGEQKVRQAVGRCRPLPGEEPLAPDDPEVDRVVARLDYVYPTLASASVRAVIAASEFKGTYDFIKDPDERPAIARDAAVFQTPRPMPAGAQRDAAHRGIVTHRVLQHFNFAAAVNSAGVASELQRMLNVGILSDEDLTAVDEASIEWFVGTSLAEAIRRAGDAYRREFQYIATESSTYFDPSVGPGAGDDVLVRGIVDGILPVADGIEIIDFKTDAVRSEDVEKRCERYRPQMELYSRAISRIWRRTVRTCWLVFMTPRETIAIRDLTSRGL
ncbi:MAG: UvrD-helicase domain-containing protein [Planctomycetota bacterium]|jgi:ATP-dependent helicase/nuclease subunit A